jgi:hypothetical protein
MVCSVNALLEAPQIVKILMTSRNFTCLGTLLSTQIKSFDVMPREDLGPDFAWYAQQITSAPRPPPCKDTVCDLPAAHTL